MYLFISHFITYNVVKGGSAEVWEMQQGETEVQAAAASSAA